MHADTVNQKILLGTALSAYSSESLPLCNAHDSHFRSSRAKNMLIHFYFMALCFNKTAAEASAALIQRASPPERSASLCVQVKKFSHIYRTYCEE